VYTYSKIILGAGEAGGHILRGVDGYFVDFLAEVDFYAVFWVTGVGGSYGRCLLLVAVFLILVNALLDLLGWVGEGVELVVGVVEDDEEGGLPLVHDFFFLFELGFESIELSFLLLKFGLELKEGFMFCVGVGVYGGHDGLKFVME
jgi:hypothetical protein